MQNLPVNNSTQRIVNMPVASVQAQSTEALIQAIHSRPDDGFAMDRARRCLKLYYEPDMSAEDRADMLDLYAKALSAFPRWAVSRGFDQWERSGTRRPSPGEIGILASRAVKEMTDEVARRSKDVAPPEPPREPVSAERATEIMEAAGFTPKRIEAVRAAPMAASVAEAEERFAAPAARHWTETASAADLAQLAAARAKNKLMQDGMAEAARRADAAKPFPTTGEAQA